MPRTNDGSATGGDVPPSPGLATVERAVQFTNAQVLDPTANLSGRRNPTGMDLGANALAEQAGAMMIQDVRSFMQGMEQVMIPVGARALEEMLNNNPGGAAAIAEMVVLMNSLAAYAGEVITAAASAKGILE